jgi:coenzyme PQQ biosynthesis protein PqqD
VLLAPERGFRLNESAAAILRLCDGQTSLLQIAERLAPSAERAQALSDVLALAEDLQGRGLLIVTSP